jgi:signal transduction histidine kinase
VTDGVWTVAARRWVNWLAIGVVISAIALAWLGYRAISEWQQQATLLARRSADAAVDLLVTAITRDMRAVQTSVLASLHFDKKPTSTLDLNAIGSAFARYPYPDAFFSGRVGPAAGTLTFYSRADRPPEWLPRAASDTTFPVVRGEEPLASGLLMTRIGRDAAEGKRFSAFDVRLKERAHQVVALLEYTDAAREELETVVGFLVDLDWVAARYFDGITAQVERISGTDNGIRLTVLDAQGRSKAGPIGAEAGAPNSTRRFPLLFFDPTVVEVDPPSDLTRDSWSAYATVSGDRALIAARQGAGRTLVLVAGSALVLAGGLALMVRADQATARLTDLRSDFVSAVTHELKTPVAAIRAISETLASGRSSHPEMAKEYAQLAVHEAKRLTRLIDNLLAYSRMSDVAEAYAFEALSFGVLARQSLKDFSSQLAEAGFAVEVDIPNGLPLVRADRTSIGLAIDNVVDNAIRYSTTSRHLSLAARAEADTVVLEVRDAGRGIPPEELPQVTRRFFRGHGEAPGGSGLGLSITQRIVTDHGGALSIRSEVGTGTTVAIALPAARLDYEEAHLGR